MSKLYSFLTEIKSLVPTRNPESEVGDPIGGVDQETEATRRKAKRIKAQAELIASQTQLQKTKYDASKIQQQINADKEEQANIEADKQKQQQQALQAQQAANQQAQQINQYVDQQVNGQQDPTIDPNAQLQ
jgi:chromosome segregation ATPase